MPGKVSYKNSALATRLAAKKGMTKISKASMPKPPGSRSDRQGGLMSKSMKGATCPKCGYKM